MTLNGIFIYVYNYKLINWPYFLGGGRSAITDCHKGLFRKTEKTLKPQNNNVQTKKKNVTINCFWKFLDGRCQI